MDLVNFLRYCRDSTVAVPEADALAQAIPAEVACQPVFENRNTHY
jgi:hypothetical protein